MLAATDYAGIALLITAIGGSVAAIGAMVFAGVAARRVDRVHKEVRTWNELTLGQLGEAEETRRVQKIAPEDRTTREARHLRDAE